MIHAPAGVEKSTKNAVENRNKHLGLTGNFTYPCPAAGEFFFYIKEENRNINPTLYSKISAFKNMEAQDIVNRRSGLARICGSRNRPEKENFTFLF